MVICQLHLQDSGFQSVTSGRMMVISQLHQAVSRLSVCYMRQDDGYLSIT